MPDDARLAQHKREACQMLMLSEGWRVLLAHLMERLTFLDQGYIFKPYPQAEREMAIGARMELTQLVHWVSDMAGLPNPFDTHRAALWSSLEPPCAPEPPSVVPVLHEDVPARTTLVQEQRARSRQRARGGV